MKVESFKQLIVWQKAMDFTINLYALTTKFPKQEMFGLASQLQRASISIPSNIAEGSKRSSRADYRQFCLIALGSAAEVETQLLLVQKLYKPTGVDKLLNDIVEIQKMLTVLVGKLKTPTQ